MKAERRHELKTNALARGLEGFPDYWREYGSRAMLVVLVALLAFLAVRYWNQKKEADARRISDSVEIVQSSLQQIQQQPQLYARAPAKALIDARQHLRQEALSAINTIIDNAKDPARRTAAYLNKGELDWRLANMPPLPGAETQPDLQVKSDERDRLLDESRIAYEQALQSASDPFTLFASRNALAAIAEDQGQWDKAREQYQQISSAANLPAGFRQYATDRLKELGNYEKTVLIEPPPATPAMSTTHPSTQPTTGPQGAPTTEPTTTTAPPSTDVPSPSTQPAPADTQPAATTQPGS